MEKARIEKHKVRFPSRARRLFLLLCGLTFYGQPFVAAGAPEMPLLMRSDFESGTSAGWRPNIPANWRVVDAEGGRVYELFAPGQPGRVRAPTSWSLLEGFDLTSFELTGRFKSTADPANMLGDLCIFFHFKDPEHFFYVHFAGASDEVHNIIGLVNGSDRVKVNREAAGGSTARLKDRGWHTFKVTCDAVGEVKAYIDDLSSPVLTARDDTFGHGLVGVGSFDDTGLFDDIELRGIRRTDPAVRGLVQAEPRPDLARGRGPATK
ncbi:MAG: hypothetical protein OEW05_01205 [Candidatus Aminicenantes bacterium]|nr:hypothetical protein [Candidatus Aminicenantes bacterium]